MANMSLKTIASSAIGTIDFQFDAITEGSTIIPTDRKKMAPKRSFIPEVTRLTSSAWTVPAIRDPAIKAPSSMEKPSLLASRAIEKQSPMDRTASISSLMRSMILLRTVGRMYIPRSSHATR